MSGAEHRYAFLWLAALLAACGQSSAASSEAEPYRPSPDCPLSTTAAWQGFLVDAARRPSWTTTCSDQDNCDELLGDFDARVQSEIVDVLARCEADLEAYPRLAQCTSRLRRFLPAWRRQHTAHSYGFDQPNDGYFLAQDAALEGQRSMELPAELLAALPDAGAIEQVAQDLGWPYLVHDSGLGGTRFIFDLREPDGRYERWFVFEIDPKSWQIGDPTIVSFIGLETPEGARPRPHFRDYLVRSGASGWTAELPEGFGGKCYACHPNGLRQLLPSAGSVTLAAPVRGEPEFGGDFEPRSVGLARLGAFNRHIASFTPPDWGSSLEVADHGPALGSSLGCPSCHDGQTRGALSVMTSEGTLWQKVVGQLSMGRTGNDRGVPDAPAMALLERLATGAELSETDASELDAARARHERDFRDLVASRAPELERWLLENECE